MTRAQIRAAATRRVLASLASAPLPTGKQVLGDMFAGLGDPITLNEYIDEIVMDLSRNSDFVFLPFVRSDLTSGQASYCFPDMKYIEGATVQYADGTFHDLVLRRSEQLQAFAPSFRDGDGTGATIVGNPVYGAVEGGERIRLYPIPNYSVIASGMNPKTGLVLRGLAVLSNASWPNDSDPCPLPDRTHEAVYQGVAWKLLKAVAPGSPMAREWQLDYARGKANFQAEMNTLVEACRSHAPTLTETQQYSPFWDNY